jgi:hypothetical protein
MGELPVGAGAGEISQRQACQKHNECEDDHQGSAFGCAITGTKEIFHRVECVVLNALTHKCGFAAKFLALSAVSFSIVLRTSRSTFSHTR